MKKVLLVSPFPFSKTGRGMDVLTECFDESSWDTSHLTFPNVFYTVKKNKNFETNVSEFKSKRALIPYIDSLMKWFPKTFFLIMSKYQMHKARFINFSNYDYVVLESGKPLFLLDLIPKSTNIIYRQSDSVRYVLGKNKHYIELEDRIIEKSVRIIVVKERFKNLIGPSHEHKIDIIRNGYSIPQSLIHENPFSNGEKNAIYVGLTKLDVRTLKEICIVNRDLHIHIFGDCLNKIDLFKLRKLRNFTYHGFQPRDKYLSYMKHSNIAIFPFKSWDSMKWVGFTSKYLNFMYYQLPIVSYLTGEESEFEGMGVHFAKDYKDFAQKVFDCLKENIIGESNVDFTYFSNNERKKVYKKFIKSLL